MLWLKNLVLQSSAVFPKCQAVYVKSTRNCLFKTLDWSIEALGDRPLQLSEYLIWNK